MTEEIKDTDSSTTSAPPDTSLAPDEITIAVPDKDAALAEFAIEIWRLPKLLDKLISRLDYDEQNKYHSQFAWFNKKAIEYLYSTGMTIASLDKMPFDVGMPVTPINIGDFDKDDELVIDQVLEPVIMQNGKIIKTGSVLLKKADK